MTTPKRRDDARRDYQQSYYDRVLKPRREGLRESKRKPTREDEKKILISTRLKASLMGRITRIVNEANATGRWPWKTTTAAIEGLLFRGFETLKGDEMIDEMLPYLEATQQVDAIHRQRTEAQAMLSRVKTEVSELLAIKAEREARQCFHMTLESVEAMTPGIWRDWLIAKLEQAFPRLVKATHADLSLKFGRRRQDQVLRAVTVKVKAAATTTARGTRR